MIIIDLSLEVMEHLGLSYPNESSVSEKRKMM